MRSQIRALKNALDFREKQLDSAVAELQAMCAHPAVAKTPRANYDPSADSYWYDCVCPDCDKKWREDQ